MKTTINEHIDDTNVHLTDEYKKQVTDAIELNVQAIKASAERMYKHIEDDTVHVSSGMLDDIKNSNTKVETIHEEFYEEVEDNFIPFDFNSPLPSNSPRPTHEMEAKVMVLDKKFFPWGQITEIELPYEYGEDATVHMAVQIIEKGEKFDATKTAAQTIYSSNSQTQPQGGNGKSIFTFTNLYVPYDFEAVRLSFVSDTSQVPDYHCNNCTAFGVRYVDFAKSSDKKHFEIWDYYDVIAKFGAIIRVAYKRNLITNIYNIVYQTSVLDSALSNHIEEFIAHKNDFNAHKNNDTHLTATQKTAIS